MTARCIRKSAARAGLPLARAVTREKELQPGGQEQKILDSMATDIVGATSDYEAWLKEMTEVQRRALARKHDEMSEGPFPLLRATFYRWMKHWESLCPDLHARDGDVVLAVGDLHVENFGMWLDSRQRLVWGINDRSVEVAEGILEEKTRRQGQPEGRRE